ncbi:hypothetical protein [Spongiivirga citrea]|uniref:Isoleucyl-tRNA synthetase n=1 Tax=Spongiivirga citrea TaxID=1481457 RepID=A0A6M0CYZ0_9FLAO|nr:hypothetical protein [Spongiivirga citrea]NER18980.1 hypothetical protein [Spongiivirga citrea]
MKHILRFLLIVIIIGVAVGYYFKNSGDSPTGDKIIGISILALSFILMPLFIYHRYKNKDLSGYSILPKNDDENDEEDRSKLN